MLKMVDGTGIIGVDMVCPLGGAVSPPQPPNYDKVEMEGAGSLMLSNSLKAPLERVELTGNSVQGENPAPDNPQEIESVGRKSKNLLNLQKQPDVKETYLGWKVSDGRNVVLSVKDKGNNADITGCYLGLSRTGGSSDGVVWVVNNGSVAVKEVVSKNQYVSVFPSNETTVRKLLERFDIQVEYGNNATDYEPYGYFLDVKVTGKNQLSNKPADWQIGKKTSWSATPEYPIDANVPDISNALIFINVKPSTKYTFINKLTNKMWVNRIIERDVNGIGVRNHGLYIDETLNKNKYDFTTKDNTANIIFQIKKVDVTELLSSDIESIKIMLVEGEADENAPYELYTEQTLTLTSDRPLTKWDKLVEQGGQYGWLYQSVIDSNVKPSRTDLFPNGFSLFKDFGNGVYVYKVTNIKKAIGFQTSLCEQFKNKDGSYSTGDLFCYSDQPSMQMQYFVTDIPTLEEFKTWMETNPLTMVYQTVESQFIPLSESEQTQLRNLHSYNGTTNITVDSGEVPCGIKLTYRKEK